MRTRSIAVLLAVTATVASPVATTAVFGGQASSTAQEKAPTSVRIDGWIRSSIEATTSAARRDADAADRTDVPHDELAARNLLTLRARYARGRSLEAAGSVLVGYSLFKLDEGPATRTGASRSDLHGEVREAYVGFFAPIIDIRVGMQRIAWGHADTFAPNDIVNANDLRDPILSETELLHRPTFAVRVDVERPYGTLQFVARPFLQPDRYDVYGSNWAFVQPDAPVGYRGALSALAQQLAVSRKDAGERILVDAARPGGLAGFQGGLRYDWKARGVDVSHYYDYGYHGTPAFRIDRGTVALLDAVDWASVSRDQAVTLLSGLAGGTAVGSTWERRQHVGLDVGTTKGPFALRVDAAYQHPALFYDRTLNGWLSPAVQAVFGAELQTADLGRTVLVEARYRHIQHEPPRGGLLFAERNALDTAWLVRWTWLHRLELEARGVAGRSPRSYVFRPQIAWKRDGLAIRLGALVLDGEEGSFGEWYGANRSVYVMVRRAF